MIPQGVSLRRPHAFGLIACLLVALWAAPGRSGELEAAASNGDGPAGTHGPGEPGGAGDEASRWRRWERVASRPLPGKTPSISLPALWLIRFFQKVVSPVDGPSCDFTPSCSRYGLEAIRRNGLLLGIPMTTERIVRNHHPDNPRRYPLVERDGGIYHLDPVEANDFWWRSDP